MKHPKLYLTIDENCPFKDRVTMGKYCYGTEQSPRMNFYRGNVCHLTIGNFTSFAPNVVIHCGGEHFTEYVSAYPFSIIFDDVPAIEAVKHKGDIIIGSDVWIGSHVIILSGVTIGDGAVIGAGSVVTKDVAPYSIAAGNPAREIRKRFTCAQIEKLLTIKWWNWDDATIDKFIPMIMSKDIDNFIRVAEEVREVSNAV